MPKCIEVSLGSVICNYNCFGGSIRLNGSAFGATFRSNPEDPHEQTAQKTIFAFPKGRFNIAEGPPVPIEMQESVTFYLSTPDTEPEGSSSKFLKIGGELNNNLGRQFVTIDDLVQLPITGEAPPRHVPVVFETPNLKITLVFLVSTQQPEEELHGPLVGCARVRVLNMREKELLGARRSNPASRLQNLWQSLIYSDRFERKNCIHMTDPF